MSASGGAGGNCGHSGANEGAGDWLTVFPKHPTADDVYYINSAWAPAAITVQDKRLTEAELMSEYWKCMSGLYDGHGKAARVRFRTIERFAKQPHFDEGS